MGAIGATVLGIIAGGKLDESSDPPLLIITVTMTTPKTITATTTIIVNETWRNRLNSEFCSLRPNHEIGMAVTIEGPES